MNQQKAALFLPLITALAEGKTIQYYNMANTWIDKPDPSFADDTTRYRIKPEPRTFYVAVNKNPDLPVVLITEDSFNAKSNPSNFEYIKVVEVIQS